MDSKYQTRSKTTKITENHLVVNASMGSFEQIRKAGDAVPIPECYITTGVKSSVFFCTLRRTQWGRALISHVIETHISEMAYVAVCGLNLCH